MCSRRWCREIVEIANWRILDGNFVFMFSVNCQEYMCTYLNFSSTVTKNSPNFIRKHLLFRIHISVHFTFTRLYCRIVEFLQLCSFYKELACCDKILKFLNYFQTVMNQISLVTNFPVSKQFVSE